MTLGGIEIAGSLRRGRETVKDIDILVTSREPARVMKTFASLPSGAEVLAEGPTRATILHKAGRSSTTSRSASRPRAARGSGRRRS